jgi:hypothetical protein
VYYQLRRPRFGPRLSTRARVLGAIFAVPLEQPETYCHFGSTWNHSSIAWIAVARLKCFRAKSLLLVDAISHGTGMALADG